MDIFSNLFITKRRLDNCQSILLSILFLTYDKHDVKRQPHDPLLFSQKSIEKMCPPVLICGWLGYCVRKAEKHLKNHNFS